MLATRSNAIPSRGALYDDVKDPHRCALLNLAENHAYFVEDVGRFTSNAVAELTRNRSTMSGEPTRWATKRLDDTLIPGNRRCWTEARRGRVVSAAPRWLVRAARAQGQTANPNGARGVGRD